jgi:hypothetical protein
MTSYKFLSVIQLRTDVGIIAAIEDHKFLVMFETINNGVEFKWYPTSMIAKYRVIG